MVITDNRVAGYLINEGSGDTEALMNYSLFQRFE